MSNIANLRMSSYYSIEDSLLSVDDIIDNAIKNNQTSVAFTNKGKMFKTVEFYKKARAKGLKPIIGLDAYIENDLTKEQGSLSRILILAKNEAGYKKLISLNSRSSIENIINGKSAIKESWLKDGVSDLIALSGEDVDNLFFEGFEKRKNLSREEFNSLFAEKKSFVELYKTFFPSGFYLEILRTDREVEENFIPMILNLSKFTKTPIVGTQSAKFLSPIDYGTHIVKTSLPLGEYADRKALNDEYGRGQYLMSSKEMEDSFKDLPRILENAKSVAEMCNVKISMNNNALPDFPTPNGETQDEYLRILANRGMDEVLKRTYDDPVEKEKMRPVYEERMNYELDIIASKNFSSYFLTVASIVNKAREKNITVGIGRGSAVGSLVTNLVGITGIDPIEYGLYFERFLNPERMSMPDIDVDFPSDERKDVIKIISDSYNQGDSINVAQITTFNMYKVKNTVAALRRSLSTENNVARDVNFAISNIERNSDIKKLSKISEIIDPKSDFYDQEFAEKYEESRSLQEFVSYIDGITESPANISRHASGIVISKDALTEYTPLTKIVKDGYDIISTQFDKSELEDLGLIKFDILGVKNLDFTDSITKKINERSDVDEEFSLKNIKYNDPQVFSLFKDANSGGIFQFESEQMKKILREIKVDSFNDVIAANALVRPSASKYVSTYANRKLGKEKTVYIHPLMKEITDYTYGIMIYQEQIMKAAQVIAGYSLGEGEILRKAISSKNETMINDRKEDFINRAVDKNNIPKDVAEKIFEDIRGFASYGFNKSHAVAYSHIAYQNAYLKLYYPKEFFLTLLEQSDKNALNKILPDIYKNGFDMKNPDINQSNASFTIDNKKMITMGLTSIKGINESIAKKIVKARKDHGDFVDMFDFCKKVGREDLNKNIMTNMINSGCFDSIVHEFDNVVEKRSFMLNNIEEYINYSAKNSRNKKEKGFILSDLFGDEGIFKNAKKTYSVDFENIENPEMFYPENNKDYQMFSEQEIGDKEMDAIGVFISIDPLKKYKKDFKEIESCEKLINMDNQETDNNLFAAVLMEIKPLKTKAQKDFFKIKISDGKSIKELNIFNDADIDKLRNMSEGDLISFKKKINNKGFCNVSQFNNIRETQNIFTKKINIAMPPDKMNDIITLLRSNGNGDTPVTIYVPEVKTNSYAMLNLPIKVNMTMKLRNMLTEMLGDEKYLKLDYKENINYRVEPEYNYKTPKPSLSNRFSK